MSEVEEWLNQIGLPEYYLYFEEDGWTDLDAVTLMSEDDLKAITNKRGHVAILIREIERLKKNLTINNIRNNIDYDYINGDNVEFIDDSYINERPSRRDSRRSKSATRAVSTPAEAKSFFELADYVYTKYGFGKFGKGMSHFEQTDVNQERLDRGRFRDHYTNNYIWVEKNHVNDVGVRYDGLSKKVDQKPSHWKCEDEIERGKEFKRLNDECGDKISDNRYSIDNSRDWLVDDGGVVERVHKLSASHAKTRYDLAAIKRNVDNIKLMRQRLLQ